MPYKHVQRKHVPFKSGSFWISLFLLMLNRDDPRVLVSLWMSGLECCMRLTTAE